MLHLNSSTVYYWHHGADDMRKSFDALGGIVNQHCPSTILQGGVYIFLNRRRNQIKLLTWEGDGLAIYSFLSVQLLQTMRFFSYLSNWFFIHANIDTFTPIN